MREQKDCIIYFVRMTDGKRLGADNVTKTERYGKTIDGRRENRIGSENRLCSNMYSTLSLAARNDITKKKGFISEL